jgi:type IV pilus assembly protein PilF
MRTVFTLGLTLLLLLCAGCSGGDPNVRKINEEKAAEANAELGLRYMMQGDYQIALEKLKKALDFNDESANAHHYIAELYRRLGETEKAQRHYEDALSYSESGNSSLYNNYGVFLCNQRRFDEAEEMFQRVLKDPVYKQRAKLFENMGLCQQDKPDPVKAEEYFRQALKYNPKRPRSLQAMAKISFDEGSHLSARAYLQRYLEVARHTPQTLWLGIRVERVLGDKNAVASYALLLERNFPKSPEAELYRKSVGR